MKSIRIYANNFSTELPVVADDSNIGRSLFAAGDFPVIFPTKDIIDLILNNVKDKK
jgi:hypothetical protein